MAVLNALVGDPSTSGGALGYVGKLKQALADVEDVDHLFLPPGPADPLRRTAPYELSTEFIRGVIEGRFAAHTAISLAPAHSALLSQALTTKSYKALHVHRPWELIAVWRFLQDSGSSLPLILTIHNPIRPSDEFFPQHEALHGREAAEQWREAFRVIEDLAMCIPDALILPAPEAVSAHLATWPAFADLYDRKPVGFVPTGTAAPALAYETSAIRSVLGIPDTAVVVSYVGRKIPVKGFDLFAAAAQQMLSKHSEVFVLTAGMGPGAVPATDRWINLGWSRTAGDVLNASDLIVAPNRETYFDLGIIEALALGKYVITTRTGGNIALAKLVPSLVTTEPDIGSVAGAISAAVTAGSDVRERVGRSNRTSYAESLTLEKFGAGYLEILRGWNLA